MQCTINGQPMPVQSSAVHTPPYHEWTLNYFTVCPWTREARVEITYDHPVTSAVVRPLSAGICPEVHGCTVAFTMTEAIHVSVEPDNNLAEAMQVFPYVPSEPDFTGYDHVYRFEAGEHDVDELHLTQDRTAVYLAPGATVHGRIFADGVAGLKIFGPGALTMRRYHREMPEEMLRCMEIRNCRDVVLEDLCVLDSCCWSVRLNESQDIAIRNIKIIGCRGNADGIDVTGSSHVRISGCFIRTYDDSFVIKSLWGGNVEDVVFEKSTLWNDMARPIEVGVEMRCAHVRNITFRDIDVIHSLTPYPIFGIHHGDRALVSDIRFENIRIEHAPGGQLFDFRITDSVWNTDTQKGEICNLYINDISLVGAEGRDFRHVHCRAVGFDETHTIENIHIGRITAFGKVLSGGEALGLQSNAYTHNIAFEQPETPVLTAKMLPGQVFAMGKDGRYHGTLKLEVCNNTPETACGEIGIKLFPMGVHQCDETPKPYRLASGERVCYEYAVTAAPGKLAAETRSSRVDCRNDFYYCELDYPMPERIADAPALPLTTLYGHRDGEVRFALRNGWLEIAADAMKHHDLTLYAALPPKERADNEVLFTVEESYYGEGPCIKWKDGALCPAPEIGNHFEITYVFLNQPKTEIHTLRLPRNHEGLIRVPMASLNLPKDSRHLWLELELHRPTGCCKPYTLFRSTLPQDTAHMFCSCRATK
ncbi:MAG: hypothetical protein IJY28_04840 [Clostridia bacterium]|nr:hypothetical protein [Clostridia bacterium]